MPPAATRHITLYTRPGCHLCEEAADLLERLARDMPLEIVAVNILDDADLFERYKHCIPVVSIADGPTLLAPINEAELLRAFTEQERAFA
jgi:thiol-disulfide isomerase/thioredoxin